MIRKFSTFANLGLTALGLCALAGPASAQMGPPPHDMMFERHMGPPPPEMEKAMAEHRAEMARDLHTVLRLRPDQESAWQAFQAAMAPPARPERPPGPPPMAQTTPERLDMMGKHMAQMEAHRARMDAATRAFYAALSPEQQQVFDALERLRGPHGPGRGGPRMMFHRIDMPPPH
jgi:protein CpxP